MDAYVDGWTMDGAMWRARVEQKSERDIASLFFLLLFRLPVHHQYFSVLGHEIAQ